MKGTNRLKRNFKINIKMKVKMARSNVGMQSWEYKKMHSKYQVNLSKY